MVGEVLLVLFFLALGCLCLSPARRHCWSGNTTATRRSAERIEENEKPKMIISVTLCILFLVIGKAFLVMALSSMF